LKKLALLLLLAVAAFGFWYHETEWPVRHAQDPPQILSIPLGSSVLDIGRELRNLGLVRHPQLFRAYVLTQGSMGRLRAGDYQLEGDLSLRQIVDKLEKGDVIRSQVTFREGMNLADMATLAGTRGIPVADFLKAAKDPAPIRDLDPEAPDLEGYLFPDTYDIPQRGDRATQIVAKMVERFREVAAPHLAKLPERKLSAREWVTLASVVELETAQGSERPRIAAVFLNRLRIGMPLQTDPTVIYALRKAGTWDGNIRKGDLDIDSPYNTYRRPGLPPGPIASPGKEALAAVLEPAPGSELYFVSRNDGTHQFSSNLDDHNRAVTRFQRHRASEAPAGSDPGTARPPTGASPGAALPPPTGSPAPRR
jgi:UPF0755 protein